MAHPVHAPAYRVFLDRLRAGRERAGLRQADVARRLRKPQSYVSKCESGERRVDVVELAAFARLYGLPMEFFVPPPKARSHKRPGKHDGRARQAKDNHLNQRIANSQYPTPRPTRRAP